MSEPKCVYKWLEKKYDNASQSVEIGLCSCVRRKNRMVAFAKTDELPDRLGIFCKNQTHFWKDIELVPILARIPGRSTTKKLLTALISGWIAFKSDQQLIDGQVEEEVAGFTLLEPTIKVIDVPLTELAADVGTSASDGDDDDDGATGDDSVSIAMPGLDTEEPPPTQSWHQRITLSWLLQLARTVLRYAGTTYFAREALYKAWVDSDAHGFVLAIVPLIQSLPGLQWLKDSVDSGNVGTMMLLGTMLYQTQSSAQLRYVRRAIGTKITPPSAYGKRLGEQMEGPVAKRRGRSRDSQHGDREC